MIVTEARIIIKLYYFQAMEFVRALNNRISKSPHDILAAWIIKIRMPYRNGYYGIFRRSKILDQDFVSYLILLKLQLRLRTNRAGHNMIRGIDAGIWKIRWESNFSLGTVTLDGETVVKSVNYKLIRATENGTVGAGWIGKQRNVG